MSKNEEITSLAEDIINDIVGRRLPLPSVLLKASRLALLLDLQPTAEQFKAWAKDAEYKKFEIGAYPAEVEAAKDPNISISSANPNQYVGHFGGNAIERGGLRNNVRIAQSALAAYRTETHAFALNIYTKWQFGNITETIYEKKRLRTDPILQKVFPDYNNRIKSIEENLTSTNPEDWKSAVVSCRTLMMDLAETLNPAKNKGKDDYINRLKTVISPKSKTKGKLLRTHLEELKKRIEYVIGLTQGPAHTRRPAQEEAEDIALYTYLIISELMGIYSKKEAEKPGK